MKNSQLKGNLMLIFTALIWGAAFVAQDMGMDFVGPFTFNAARMLIGALTLVPVIIITDIYKKKNLKQQNGEYKIFGFSKIEVVGGIICGGVLFVASSFQQWGISLYTDADAAAGKSGFITALYIVIVPIMGLLLRRKTGALVWVSAAIATGGMYLLCVKENFKIGVPDILLLFCAISFAVHILVIDYYSPKVNGIKLSAVQFLTSGIFAAVATAIFESPTTYGVLSAAVPILYAGMLSCSIAYTMQTVAQKYTKPAIASVIMSLESVFAAITGWIFGESLSPKEQIGCVLVFAAVLLAQTNPEMFKKTKKIKG